MAAKEQGVAQHPPDIERLLAYYDIKNFTYRTWDDGATRRPLPAEVEMSTTKKRRAVKGTPVPLPSSKRPMLWKPPDDLQSVPLPMLERMGDTSSLVARCLGARYGVARPTDEGDALPELRESTVEVTTERTTERTSARHVLRDLALKGVKDG